LDNGDLHVEEATNNNEVTKEDVEIVETKKSISKRTTGGRKITGDACEYIMLCDIINNAGCDDGSKFVVQEKTGVRKQFLILNGSPVLGFVEKNSKFTKCNSYTQITASVSCEEVPDLRNVDLSSSFRTIFKGILAELEEIEMIESRVEDQPRAAGRIIKGDDCEFIRLCDIPSNPGCTNGHKFVITKEEGVRKQFLILNGSPVLGFVNNGRKFSSCSSYTEVTADVDCKEVPGLESVDLSSEVTSTDISV